MKEQLKGCLIIMNLMLAAMFEVIFNKNSLAVKVWSLGVTKSIVVVTSWCPTIQKPGALLQLIYCHSMYCNDVTWA